MIRDALQLTEANCLVLRHTMHIDYDQQRADDNRTIRQPARRFVIAANLIPIRTEVFHNVRQSSQPLRLPQSSQS